MDLHKEACKEKEHTLANLGPAERVFDPLLSCLPYNTHLMNRSRSVCMGESLPPARLIRGKN